jgi:Protein kinase domain
MLNLADALRQHCSGLDAALVERHLRRMPPAYFERFAVTEIARHLRLLSDISATEPLSLDVRNLGPQVFEIIVGCINYPGTVACITTALAADSFNLEDVQIASYVDPAEEDEPDCSVISLRVSGPSDDPAEELTERLHDRMRAAFVYLAAGNFLEAQAAAARSELPRSAPPVRAQVGLILGDYRLEKRLARGGMSEVYLATQLSLDRTVAVKIARQEGGPDDELSARFTREAMVLAQFQSPYIVPVLATGTIPSGTGVLGWIAMEYQAGGDLARYVARHGPATPDLGLRWFRQSLDGLRYAHHNGVLHRDVKPHNLLLTVEGNVKLGDFGLFKYVDPDDGRHGRRPVRGTPHYMSPEQARGEHVDERSDVYSLGSTFYHIFTGRLPCEGATPIDVLRTIAQGEPPKLLEAAPELPPPLGVIFNRMLARKREDRYQDVSVLLADLESYALRELLPVAESGSYPATEAADGPATTAPGMETSAYVPSVPSDPLVGSN